MTTYILLLAVTTLFAYFADKLFKKYHKLSVLFIIGIVVFYTIIAGLRNFGIGTDTNVYIELYFNTAKSIISVKEFLSLESMDKGFLFLCWLSSQISSDLQVVLVVVELWIIAFTMHGAYMLKRDHGMKLWIFVFLYFFMFFGYSINLMRQFCAMSLLFWGFAWLRNGNWKVFAVTQVIAYYFHSSSVVFLVVPLVYFLSYMKNQRIRNYITISISIFFIVILASFHQYISVLGNLNLVSGEYVDRYGQNSEFKATAGSSVLMLLSYISIFYFLYIACRDKRIPVYYRYILVTLFSISFMFAQLNFITAYLDRLSYYISFIYLTYLVYALGSKRIPLLIRITVVSFTIFFCYRIFIENHGAEIYPYASKILGI